MKTDFMARKTGVSGRYGCALRKKEKQDKAGNWLQLYEGRIETVMQRQEDFMPSDGGIFWYCASCRKNILLLKLGRQYLLGHLFCAAVGRLSGWMEEGVPGEVSAEGARNTIPELSGQETAEAEICAVRNGREAAVLQALSVAQIAWPGLCALPSGKNLPEKTKRKKNRKVTKTEFL